MKIFVAFPDRQSIDETDFGKLRDYREIQIKQDIYIQVSWLYI